MNCRAIAKALLNEHPQTIAIALTRLHAEQAGDILKLLPTFLQADLVQRISQTDELPAEVLEEIDALLAEILRSQG